MQSKLFSSDIRFRILCAILSLLYCEIMVVCISEITVFNTVLMLSSTTGDDDPVDVDDNNSADEGDNCAN